MNAVSCLSAFCSLQFFCALHFPVMTDLYVRELEEKVAQYETIMSRCPQCKQTLPSPEAEPIEPSSRQSRSHRSVQQPVEKMPPPARAGPPKRTTSTSTPASRIQSSRQLRRPSRTELQSSDVHQSVTSALPVASINRSHRPNEVPISAQRHPLINRPDQSAPSLMTSSAAESSEQTIGSSQTLSAQPPSIALPTAPRKYNHDGELISLGPQPYKKPRARTQTGRPPGESPRHAEWMRTADIMLEEVPSGWHWRDKVMKMDSSVIAAVAMDDAPTSERVVSPAGDAERQKLVRLVRRFAERHSEGRVDFEHFILVCLCMVLSSQGVSRDTIRETLQICISDTSERNIDRYLKGANWANILMSELFLTEWGYRAIDLIAICKIFERSMLRLPLSVCIQGTDLSPLTVKLREHMTVANMLSQN